MNWHIIRQDWWLIRSTPYYRFIFILLAIFLCIGAWNGMSLNRQKMITQEAIRESEQAKYDKLEADIRTIEQHGFKGSPSQDPSSPSNVAGKFGGRYVLYPLQPISGWVLGQSDLYPAYRRITATRKAGLILNEEVENPQILFNGSFDVAFVLIFLLPLLIIGFTYNLAASEREWGTLQLLLSGPVSLRRIVMIKLIFRFVLLGSFLAILLILCALATGVQMNASFGALLMLSIVWTACWFAFSFLGNAAVNDQSGSTASILVALWLFFVVLLPGMLSYIVGELYPTPSRITLITETREAAEDVKKRSSRALARYLEDHPELTNDSSEIDAKDFVTKFYVSQIELERTLAPLEAQFNDQLRKQQTWVRRFQWLSPALVMQEKLSIIAHTDENSYRIFTEHVEAFYKILQAHHTERILRKQAYTSKNVASIPVPPDMTFPDLRVQDVVGYLLSLSASLLFFGWMLLGKMGLISYRRR